MSPNNGIYPRKQQKPKTHMCIGKDLLHDGEPYNQHRHQATLQPGEAVRRAMAWGEEWTKWAQGSNIWVDKVVRITTTFGFISGPN